MLWAARASSAAPDCAYAAKHICLVVNWLYGTSSLFAYLRLRHTLTYLLTYLVTYLLSYLVSQLVSQLVSYLVTYLFTHWPCHGKLTGGAVASDGRTVAHLFLDDVADDTSLLAISVTLVDIGTKPSVSDDLTTTGVLMPNPLTDALHSRNINDLQLATSLQEMNYCIRARTTV